MTKQEIEAIASKVTSGLGGAGINPAVVYGTAGPSVRRASVPGGWLFDTVDEAVARAQAAQRVLAAMTLEERGRLIEAMRGAGRDNARKLAQMAHDETGYGHVEHKILKNLLAANKTPGIEDLETRAWSGDYGLTLVEMAPFGVIASITPSTNPPSTVINNSISMIAAGNAVVFNPHPAAKKVSQEAMRVLNEAVTGAGGPEGLITTVREPTLETGAAVMAHPAIPLLSITGGEAVVRAAMKTGKKVIAAGPGNPPVIVDDTAILAKAAKDIVDGASFDNNVLCVAEKEVFAFDSVTDALIAEMIKNGAFLIKGGDINKVLAVTLINKDGKYVINRKYVGRNASLILRDAGVAFSGEPALVIAEVDPFHPFIMTEMLMPVLGIARVRDIDDAVAHAIRAEQGCQHSALIHSTNIRNMSCAAHALNTTIFVKNAPSYSGLGFNGEGYATLTIATPTGEGLTAAHSFTRSRRCVLYGDFRIV
ncbi:MAG: aldehyde dehydrogenase EutE [Treponema sp.]|jgi:propionaldehyde dehydrogenase|nr:aldehyde dehydrogenase EutE [Treponema sp.]